MKITKKTVSFLLSLIMLIGVCPVPFSHAVANEAPIPIESIASSDSDAQDDPAQPLVIEPGYHFCDKLNVDSEGRTIYYIEDEPSEYGLIHGKWIYIDGTEAEDPDIHEAYPNKSYTIMDDALPTAFDARDYNWIMPVEYQTGGTCWAHAAISCIETAYVKQGLGDSIDLSEYQTVWYGKNSYYNGVTDSSNDGKVLADPMDLMNEGGNVNDVSSAVLNFSGPASEERYPLTSTNYSQMVEDMTNTFTYSEKYVRDVVVEDILSVNKNNIDEVKQAVMDYGSVEVFYYNNTSNYYPSSYWNVGDQQPLCYYYPESHATSHAVTIVGWDDSLSRNCFSPDCRPEHDGAWLIKNSWSSSWGNNGYFWMSYEDKSLAGFYVYTVSDASDYEKVYMYDGIGYGTYKNVKAAANVFTANGNQYLTKVSYGTSANMDYVLKIYKNLPSNYSSPTDGTLAYTQSGNTENQRYIDIVGDVCISDGEIFSVVIEASRAYFETSNSARRITSGAKESYFMDGTNIWNDVKDQDAAKSGNCCIRAVAKTITPAGSYKVKLKDGPHFEQIVLSDGDTVELPSLEGCTYIFTYNGVDFDGTGVDKDMTVSVHCYPTLGTIDENVDPCTTEYKCIYCGREILPSVTEHTYQTKEFAASKNSPGYTKYTCSICSKYDYRDFNLYSGAVGGVFEDLFWQYYDGTLSIFTIADIPDFESESDVPWNEYKNDITKLNVSEGATRLGKYAFSGLSKLTDMTLGSTIKEIGSYCFKGASSLAEFTCPADLEKMENYIFYGASSLTTIDYNSKISYLGSYIFKQCNSLIEATVPGTIKNPPRYLYDSCPKLKKIILSEGVTSADSIYWSCNSMDELVFSSTVVTGQFTNNGNISKYTVSPDNTVYCAVDGVLFSKDMTKLVSYPARRPGVYYNIPDSVTSLGNGTFCFTENLVYVDMSCQATSLPYLTFNQTRSIKYVNLPTGITKINSTAVKSTKMPSLFIPSTVTNIENETFATSSSYILPNLFTDSSNAAICTYASANNMNCTSTHTEHNYSTLALETQANCSEPGMTIYTCECGNFICNTSEPNGKHSYTAQEVKPGALKSAANCTQAATYYYSCSACGTVENNDSHVFQSGTPVGHSFVWVTDVEATCGAAGKKHEKCTACNDTRSMNTAIPSTGNHSYTAQNVKPAALKSAATCTQAATYYYSCGVCGAVERNDSHVFQNGSPVSHSFAWVTDTAQTCITNGIKHEECAVCHSKRNENTAIPADGKHSYTAQEVKPGALKSAANCTQAATYYYSCSGCGAVENNNSHTFQSGAPVGHKFVWVTDVEPSCGTAGKKHEKCTVCNDTRSMNTAIPATGNHTYSVQDVKPAALKSAATCLSAAQYYYSCAVCGNVERSASHIFLSGSALTHSYTGKLKNNQNGTHSRLCVNGCGQYGAQENCNYVFTSSSHGSNCQERGKDTYTCVCGAKRITDNNKYGSHKFKNGKCTICSEADPNYVDCSCNCHTSDSFKGFFWKIKVFFWKLFKMENKRICSCGASHW